MKPSSHLHLNDPTVFSHVNPTGHAEGFLHSSISITVDIRNCLLSGPRNTSAVAYLMENFNC